MNLPNVTPRPARTVSRPGGGARQLLTTLLLLFIVVWGVKAFFSHHDNPYEKLAREVTFALQQNDVDAVKHLQNAQTATMINRGIVGRAADKLAPLGKLKSVKETTPSGAPVRTHTFDVTFDKGVVRERMAVDPDNKIVHFSYDVVPS